MTASPSPSEPVTDFEATPETDRGRWMYETLLAVHSHIRRDLDLIEELAAQARDGVDAEDLSRQVRDLKRGSILWRLQINCLRYCSFVHSHHGAEDAGFFSELRETNPAINPVIDRLQAEHRRVSDDLDAVEAAASALGQDDGQETRAAVVDTLRALRENLLAHLDYEERSIEATVQAEDQELPRGSQGQIEMGGDDRLLSRDGSPAETLQEVIEANGAPMKEGTFDCEAEFPEGRLVPTTDRNHLVIVGLKWKETMSRAQMENVIEGQGEPCLVLEQIDEAGEVDHGRLIVDRDLHAWEIAPDGSVVERGELDPEGQ